jgi:hypothetical protein
MKGEGNMNNLKKHMVKVMIIALAAYSVICGTSASAAANGAIKPQIVVSGLKTFYKFSEPVKFSIKSSNYSRKVKYKVSIYNATTKKTIDLTKGFSKSIQGYQTLALNSSLKAGGKYTLRIYVKALASKASYDNYLVKNFNMEANKSAVTAAIQKAAKLEVSKAVGSKIGNVLSSDKEALQKVIDSALTVKNNVNISQLQVDKKVKELAAAVKIFENSVIRPVDKTELVSMIKAAQQKAAAVKTGIEKGEISIFDKIALSNEITEAIKVAVDSNATASEVKTVENKLNDAITVFVNNIKTANM